MKMELEATDLRKRLEAAKGEGAPAAEDAPVQDALKLCYTVPKAVDEKEGSTSPLLEPLPEKLQLGEEAIELATDTDKRGYGHCSYPECVATGVIAEPCSKCQKGIVHYVECQLSWSANNLKSCEIIGNPNLCYECAILTFSKTKEGC